MPDPDPTKTKSFATPAKLRQWLKTNHAKRDELWVHIHKVHTGTPSVTWNDIVLETLCYGWIDGVKKSLGDDAYLQRITPRKPRSAWSKRNRQHAERLIKENRMQPAGLAQVDAAKKDGRWKNAYGPASELKIPQDFLDAVAKHRKAQATLDACNKTNRYAIAYGLTTAKRPETVQRRADKFLAMLKRGEKPDFGFKKK
ncbi:MAG: YdeI/OmpD-associated family protein [Planctomycetota bacterium]